MKKKRILVGMFPQKYVEGYEITRGKLTTKFLVHKTGRIEAHPWNYVMESFGKGFIRDGEHVTRADWIALRNTIDEMLKVKVR